MNNTTNPQKPNPGAPKLKVLQNWSAFTLKNAYQPRSPVKYIVHGLIELPSLNIVFGSPGTLKSFLLADLACCVAGGIDWLSPRPNQQGQALKITQEPVVWIDLDNGKRRTHERFAAIGRNLNLLGDAPLFYYSMPSPSLNIKDDSHRDDLISIINFHGAKLVIIDNLGAISGGADENSAEMIKVMLNLRIVAEQTGAAIIVIHHQRKSNGTNGRRGETLRGHSSIEASLDLALLVTREQDSDVITIEATKARGTNVKPFSAMFTYEHDSSGELSQARFFASSQKAITTIDTINQAIIDCLGSNTYNKTELQSLVHQSLNQTVGANKISTQIDDLVMKGVLIMAKGKTNNEQLFTVNPNNP